MILAVDPPANTVSRSSSRSVALSTREPTAGVAGSSVAGRARWHRPRDPRDLHQLRRLAGSRRASASRGCRSCGGSSPPLVGAFVLAKTKYGNWIFAVGGNKEAARATVCLPTGQDGAVHDRLAGRLLRRHHGAVRFDSVQASQGDGQEFEYIIAAVVGGNLLTGGYGSVVGASVGALIMSMSDEGIPSAGWNQDGVRRSSGVVLLLAVLVNNYVRKQGAGGTRDVTTTARSARAADTSPSTSATSSRWKTSRRRCEAGKVTCVLGDNGAGKSTFIKILSGVHKPSARRVPARRRAGRVRLAARRARDRASPPCTRTWPWCR